LSVPGPENAFRDGSPPLSAPVALVIDRARGSVQATVDGERVDLTLGVISPWVRIRFHAAPGVNVRGLTRLLVTEMDEHFSLYLAPINIDPERPAMPISHPSFYATYLAKRIGPYATLGLAEDTWALNEGVIGEDVFLQQTYDIDREREAMLLSALERQRRGAVVCVFDGTDRIQHMFWRHLEPGHPATRDREPSKHADAIRRLYQHNDALLGRVLERLQDDDLLMVISDHGFSSFRRGVNLNRWLLENGYLTLNPGADGRAEWLRDVNWSATRAYCVGLTGMFLNLAGREQQGIVSPGAEASALKAELVARLTGLRDDEREEIAIREAFDTAVLYDGPYAGNAADLVIGYNAGYRISWDSAKGVVAGPVFEDNVKAWSGDHCIDPRLVPGVFFCNRPVQAESPALIDIAPTALRLFGIDPPPHMDGRPLEGLA